MQNTPAYQALDEFRRAAYVTLGARKDSLFELLDAVVAGPGPATLVRLSLSPQFRRGWASAPDALADGTMDVTECRALVQTLVLRHRRIEPEPPGRTIWVVDGTVWPRPAAATSPERTLRLRSGQALWPSDHRGQSAIRGGPG